MKQIFNSFKLYQGLLNKTSQMNFCFWQRNKVIHNKYKKLPKIYKFKFNVQKNPMVDEYIPLKENTICDNKGAKKKRKRVGRGPGSKHGKTAGRGHKGQGARGTKMKCWFEGGQSPITRRLPKYGMKKQNRNLLNYCNINKIIYYMKRDWLQCSPDNYITIRDLVKVGAIKKPRFGVIILGKGLHEIEDFDKKIYIEVSNISENACKEIIKFGGMVRIKHRSPHQLKEHVDGKS